MRRLRTHIDDLIDERNDALALVRRLEAQNSAQRRRIVARQLEHAVLRVENSALRSILLRWIEAVAVIPEHERDRQLQLIIAHAEAT